MSDPHPKDWEGWIRAYKEWGPEQWNEFYTGWLNAGERRTEYLLRHQIQFLDWAAVDSNVTKAATSGDLNSIAAVLDRQLQGKTNNVLVGHSRGGKVIEWYLGAYGQRTAKVDAAILIEASTGLLSEFGGMLLGRNTPPSTVFGSDAWFVNGIDTKIVTINNYLFPSGGFISGAENFQTLAVDGGRGDSKASPHGLKNYLADPVFAFIRGEPVPIVGINDWLWYHSAMPFNPGPF